jgi:hypothetical protein
MQGRVISEAEAVAGARWTATESRAVKRARREAALLAEVEAILARRWAETEPTPAADVQAQVSAAGWSQEAATPATYRLFDSTGQPIKCHLCGNDDHWSPEGDAERQVVRMFVCEHEPLRIGHGLVRQVSTVALSRVIRCEAIR